MSMFELHRLMLRDHVRNDAFAAAINAMVRPDDIVVDLGAGTGFLSILAARAGARQVYAIEAADVAAVGKQLCRDNKLERQIRWFAQPSVDIATLPEPGTVLISETFGSHPFEEAAHEFVRDARKRLLRPDARILPSHVVVYAAPATFTALRDDWDLFARPLNGIDYSRLRPQTLKQIYAEVCAPEWLLAAAQCLERVELGGKTPSKRQLAARFVIERAGDMSGLVQWFELELTPSIRLSTAPDQPKTHWRQIFIPLDRAVAVMSGDVVSAMLRLDTRLSVDFSLTWEIEIRRGERLLHRFGV